MPVSSAFQEKLMGALHSAVRDFNESNDPNAAVMKAASAHDFNADQTMRLVETFNTARTIYHYKSANDRTADFAIADSAVIIPQLFSTEQNAVEAPADKEAKSHDYSSYAVSEVDYREGMVVDKAASGNVDIDMAMPGVKQYNDTTLDTMGAQATKVIRVYRDLAKTSQDNARAAASQAGHIFTKLASELSLGWEDGCRDRYSRLVAGYEEDTEYGPVMAKLSEFVPAWLTHSVNTKFAEAAVVDDRDLKDSIIRLGEARRWMEVEATELAATDALDKQANDFEREFIEALAPVLPEKRAAIGVLDFLSPKLLKAAQAVPSKPTQPNSQAPKQPALPDKKPGIVDTAGKAIVEGIGEGVKKPIAEQVGAGLSAVMTGPQERANKELSERLRDTQRQIMLEDLMANDPILSEEAPESVLNAYQAVLQLAPELSMHKEVVRAILRQSIHNVAISPYDAQAWAELEKNIRNIAGKTDTKGKPVEAKR